MTEIWSIPQCFYFDKLIEKGLPQDKAYLATNYLDIVDISKIIELNSILKLIANGFLWDSTKEKYKFWDDLVAEYMHLDEMWELVDDKREATYTWGVWSSEDSQSLQPRISKQHRPG